MTGFNCLAGRVRACLRFNSHARMASSLGRFTGVGISADAASAKVASSAANLFQSPAWGSFFALRGLLSHKALRWFGAVEGTSVTRAREPIFNVPVVIFVVSAVLAAVHIASGWLSEITQFALILDFAFIPAREISWIDPNILADLAKNPPAGTDEAAIAQHQLAVYLNAYESARPWTFITYAALHVGYLHLILNLVVLLAIGTPVARRLGVPRFLLLFAAGAAGGALMNLAVHPTSVSPLMGASAAISACWGAAARFAFDPGARLGGPGVTLRASLANRTVVTFTLAWFLTNALSGLGANPSVLANTAIAWDAHIGGFLVGFLGFALFDRPQNQGATPPA
jgi:membrane associated rhomboid family serine protease